MSEERQKKLQNDENCYLLFLDGRVLGEANSRGGPGIGEEEQGRASILKYFSTKY